MDDAIQSEIEVMGKRYLVVPEVGSCELCAFYMPDRIPGERCVERLDGVSMWKYISKTLGLSCGRYPVIFLKPEDYEAYLPLAVAARLEK